MKTSAITNDFKFYAATVIYLLNSNFTLKGHMQ